MDNATASSAGSPYNEDERFNPTKTYHPGPLKLEIKSIKNSTRTDYLPVDMNDILNEGNGRAFFTAAVLVSSIIFWSWKAFGAFLAVHGFDYLWTKIKNKLGYSNDHYETYITLGHEQNHHKGHRHGLHPGHGHHHHPHHDHHDKGWQPDHDHGWPAPHGDIGHGHHHHKKERNVHKSPYLWYHPATKLFEQPTIQYSPWGKEYELHGYDQRQAYKYKRKYGNKFTKYKRKYYRKKGKAIRKAQRKKEKAVRRKKKAEIRKKKVQAFGNKLKDWFNLPDNEDGDDGDGDEENDDLGDRNWKNSEAEIEHGHPPPPQSYYQPGQDYDALPFAGKHQKYVRIRV